jgi:sucrose-6-phosphate hydrolase SacC (GH32 family)
MFLKDSYMKLITLVVLILSSQSLLAQKNNHFIPGEVWKDTKGDPINAHGGGLLYYKGAYYWYGEYKKGNTWRVGYVTSWEDYRVQAGGVSCYSSKDLLNWKFEGVALKPDTTDSTHDLHTSKVIERPKVIYNRKTRKFVMWMHLDSEDYSYARSGVAVSDKPGGPFRFIGSERPNGAMARDMTVFQDDDGKAYHFFSSENNATMHVVLLSDDYLSHTKTEKRILIEQSREAPAVFKYNKKYYLISSGCTGWTANRASYAAADSPLGEWKQHDNPCAGNNADSTYQSQSTYVVPVRGKKDAFIFLADRWNKNNLEDSRYIWLPMVMKGGKPEIQWKDQWNFSFFGN